MLRGIALKVASAFAFSLMATTAKLESDAYPVVQIVFFRSFFALVVLLFWLAVRGEFPRALSTRRPLGHLARSMIGSVGMFFGFLSLALLPLAEATALGFVAPLITVALASLLLGETVRIYRWSAVAVGFAGVVVMLWERLGGGAGGAGVAAGFVAATAAAFATILTRSLVRSEQTGAIVFYFSLMTTALSLAALTAAATWRPDWPGAALITSQAWRAPSFGAFAAMAAVGVFGGVGQILMTQSFRYADASIIACFDYTSMIFAVALSLAVFGQQPSALVLIGSTIVAGAGLFVIWREHKLGMIAGQGREAGPQRPL